MKHDVFDRRKTQGLAFWGRKTPLREARGLTPWFWARTGLEPGLSREDRSRTQPLQGASSVCQPIGQSDDGAPFGWSA